MSNPTPNALVGALRPDDVVDAKFSATLLRAGYDQESVDDFLDRVVGDLRVRWAVVDAGYAEASRMPRPSLFLDAQKISAETFPATKFRQGYSTQEVDRFLAQAGDTLTRLDAYLGSFRFA
jgi:DivIVA domain-containing protein